MTSNQHGPYVRGYTRVTMGGTEGCYHASGCQSQKPLSVRIACILSGIAKWFKPEDLIGKKLGIVCNLAPRPMLKGKYVSEGMIFAADTADGGCSIAFYGDDTPVGSRIH